MMLRVFNYNTLEKVKTILLYNGCRVFFEMEQLTKKSLKNRGSSHCDSRCNYMYV